MARCRLFSATVQDSVCGYNNKLLLLRSSKVAPVSQKLTLVSRKHLKVTIEICVLTVGFIDHYNKGQARFPSVQEEVFVLFDV